ncbi:hypothetical protein GCM10011600_20120 [Pseudolysinimonas yzui]|uniref:Uncharacterized protein n=1 Tax=Pseudolysinimonas yzui TaxID=2708254 RepID=A0A8J3M2N8_9MICO|nr:hypothetical protein GCM10011600_20120 [Pseudolysinimonas yzui]
MRYPVIFMSPSTVLGAPIAAANSIHHMSHLTAGGVEAIPITVPAGYSPGGAIESRTMTGIGTSV